MSLSVCQFGFNAFSGSLPAISALNCDASKTNFAGPDTDYNCPFPSRLSFWDNLDCTCDAGSYCNGTCEYGCRLCVLGTSSEDTNARNCSGCPAG